MAEARGRAGAGAASGLHRYRSHTCGALRKGDVGKAVRLSGWVHRVRDHGGLLFIDLRDHYGITQVVADPDSAAFKAAETVRSEWVIRVDGKVRDRPVIDGKSTLNPELATGEIEVVASEIEALSAAKELPVPVFAAVHGSQPRFHIPEITQDIHRAVRFIRHNAAKYGIDANKLGITGASAGGHLSLTMGTQGGSGRSEAKDPVERESSVVQAVACFFPPTDFLNWGKEGEDAVGIGLLKNFEAAFGPRSAGSTAVLLLRASSGDGRPRLVRGGLGAFSNALAAAARAAGVEIRVDAEVDRINVRDGQATGVTLRSGEEITARAVVYEFPSVR